MSDNNYWNDYGDRQSPSWMDASRSSEAFSHRGHFRRAGRGDDSDAFRRREAEDVETIDYAAFFRTIWRRRGLLAVITIVGISIATFVILRMQPQYVAHAYIALGDSSSRTGLVGTSAVNAPSLPPDPGTVQTEVEILKSPQLANKVITDLGLQKTLERKPETSVGKRIATLVEPVLGADVASWFHDPHADTVAPMDEDTKASIATSEFLQRLRVATKDTSRMIDVAFEAPDARVAMTVVNKLVDYYLSNQLELRSKMAQHNSQWLRGRIEQLQTTAQNAEKAVEQFRTKEGLFSTPGGAPLLLKEMTDVSAELATAQSARAALEAQLSQLQANSDAGGSIPSGTSAAASPLLRTLEGQEAAASQQLVEAAATLGPRHPTTIGLTDRLSHIRLAIRNERHRMASGLSDDLNIARLKEKDLAGRLTELQSKIAHMNSAEVTLHSLEREAQADRLVLNNFTSRFKETSEESDVGSQRPDARIVSYAQLPVYPDKPKREILILVCSLASLLAGVATIHVLDKADPTFRSMGDLEKFLSIPILGMIPIAEAARLAPTEAARYGTRYREAVKAAFVRLFWTRHPPKVTVITSPLPAEGKTTLALSLAAMAAQSGKRTLLVDGDFWRKGASTTLNLRANVGMAELLEGRGVLARMVVTDIASGADILVPGEFSRGSLVSWASALPELLESFRKAYDIVIIDAPPILSVAEATILASHADATVLNVRWKSTPKDAALVALRKLQDSGAMVVGTILSMVHESQHAKYGHAEGNYFLASLADYHSSTGAITRLEGPGDNRRSTVALPAAEAGGHGGESGADGTRPRSRAGSLRAIAGGAALKERAAGDAPAHNDADNVTCRYALIVQLPEPKGQSHHDHAAGGTHRRLAAAIDQATASALAASVIVLRDRPPTGLRAHFIEREYNAEKLPMFHFGKPKANAFSNEALNRFLREHGVNHLFLAGMDGAKSISRTARSALDLGYRVTFVRDAIYTDSDVEWGDLLKSFEREAAFGITTNEFGEFTEALERSNEMRTAQASD